MHGNKKFNNFEVIENNIVKIELTQGKFGFCDLVDWSNLKCYKWFTWRCKHTSYIKCRVDINSCKLMHVLIMNPPTDLLVNHIDHDGLNCRRNNMEICSHHQNMMYKKISSNNTSGFKGVYWDKKLNKWRSQIEVDSKGIYLGLFENKIDAAKAYNEATLKYFGHFAFLNMIE